MVYSLFNSSQAPMVLAVLKCSINRTVRVQASNIGAEPVRKSANFHPCVWGNHFATYTPDYSVFSPTPPQYIIFISYAYIHRNSSRIHALHVLYIGWCLIVFFNRTWLHLICVLIRLVWHQCMVRAESRIMEFESRTTEKRSTGKATEHEHRIDRGPGVPWRSTAAWPWLPFWRRDRGCPSPTK